MKPAGHILAATVEMSALEELARPCDGDEFDDIDALLHALDNWAIKDKFTFWTIKRENGRAVWKCAEEHCGWKVRASFGGEDKLIRLAILEGEYTYIT